MRKEEVKRNKISLNCSIYNYISEFVFKENKNKKDYEILIEELENFDSNEINDNENILLVFKLNVLINYLNETYNDKIDEPLDPDQSQHLESQKVQNNIFFFRANYSRNSVMKLK